MRSIVVYSIAVTSPITPSEPLPPLPEILRGSLVIVEGRAPCAAALHLLHGSPAAAVAFATRTCERRWLTLEMPT